MLSPEKWLVLDKKILKQKQIKTLEVLSKDPQSADGN